MSLEYPDIRGRALTDPGAFLDHLKDGAILDEVQRPLSLLPCYQAIVDEHQYPGQFVRTGSVQSELKQAVFQSIAGRTAVFRFLPLTLNPPLLSFCQVGTIALLALLKLIHINALQ